VSFEHLSAADAAIFETFVVPRYLARFGELAMGLLLSGPEARILHFGCRTGYPDLELWQRVDSAEIVGMDASTAAIELARRKTAARGDPAIDYRVGAALPSDLEPGSFTHALTLHPILGNDERAELLSALRWLLCPGGQALFAAPLRGSFQEVVDLFREYALKHDEAEFANEIERALAARPSLETLSDEFEAAGFVDVDVEVRTLSLPFPNGRAFFEDPITRLLILPELQSWITSTDLTRPMIYVRDAMDKYWSEADVEISVNIGCASARL